MGSQDRDYWSLFSPGSQLGQFSCVHDSLKLWWDFKEVKDKMGKGTWGRRGKGQGEGIGRGRLLMGTPPKFMPFSQVGYCRICVGFLV
jgi:hypothetical protein